MYALFWNWEFIFTCMTIRNHVCIILEISIHKHKIWMPSRVIAPSGFRPIPNLCMNKSKIDNSEVLIFCLFQISDAE